MVVMKFGRFLLRHWLWVALAAALIFLALTLLIGAGQSVWFDEAYSVILAKSSPPRLLALTAADAHPPLFYLLLKIWGSLGNFNDLWLRLFSGLCATGAIFLSLLLARKCFGRRAALAAAPILLLSPFVMRYGFEIRMYALAALLAVAATYILALAVQKSSRKLWVGYGVLVALGMLTLNYLAFVFLAHLIWLIMRRRAAKPAVKIWREPWFKAYVLAVILYLPWLPFAVSQIFNSVASGGVMTDFGPTAVARLASYWFVYSPEFSLNAWQGLLVVLAAVAAIYLVVRARRLASANIKSYFNLLIIIVATPLAVMAVLSLAVPGGFFMERYTAHFAPLFYLLVGASAGVVLAKSPRGRVWHALLYALLIGTLAVGVVNLSYYGNYNFQRLRANSAQEIARSLGNCAPGRTVVADDAQTYFELAHYLPNCGNLYFYYPHELTGAYRLLEGSAQRLENQPVATAELVVVDEQNAPTPPYVRQNNYRLVKTDERFRPIIIKTYAK